MKGEISALIGIVLIAVGAGLVIAQPFVVVDIVNEPTIMYSDAMTFRTQPWRCDQASFPKTNMAVLIPELDSRIYDDYIAYGISDDSWVSVGVSGGEEFRATGQSVPNEGKGLVRGRDAKNYYVIAFGHPGVPTYGDKTCETAWYIEFNKAPVPEPVPEPVPSSSSSSSSSSGGGVVPSPQQQKYSPIVGYGLILLGAIIVGRKR